jgi:hypothetical protein
MCDGYSRYGIVTAFRLILLVADVAALDGRPTKRHTIFNYRRPC